MWKQNFTPTSDTHQWWQLRKYSDVRHFPPKRKNWFQTAEYCRPMAIKSTTWTILAGRWTAGKRWTLEHCECCECWNAVIAGMLWTLESCDLWNSVNTRTLLESMSVPPPHWNMCHLLQHRSHCLHPSPPGPAAPGSTPLWVHEDRDRVTWVVKKFKLWSWPAFSEDNWKFL